MRSLEPKTSQRRMAFIHALSDIEEALAVAFEANPHISRAEIARRLDVAPSSVSRWLNGTSNMTLETITDLFWSLEHDTKFTATSWAVNVKTSNDHRHFDRESFSEIKDLQSTSQNLGVTTRQAYKITEQKFEPAGAD